ncbi:MAG: symmetrical bis(5'-nucleosyl)-tetraphosphatase [Myxococcota bacterium]
MATYAIGDLQGCFRPFMTLLEEIEFDPERDELWIVGDLVNRGPASLEVLRWCYNNRGHIVSVLGNHDLYLLARAVGAVNKKGRDTLDDILEAEDGPELLEWLRNRPLIHRDNDWLMVHAGIHPEWTADEALQHAAGVEEQIRTGYTHIMRELMQGSPSRIDADSTPIERTRHALGVMTRMRMVGADGGVDFGYKGPVQEAPDGLTPWFAVPDRRASDVTVVFGHWAALGLHVDDAVIGLDSGCVWGNALTAIRLEDRAVFNVRCETSFKSSRAELAGIAGR